MKKLLLMLLVVLSTTGYAGIPHPAKYQWGFLEVPENYSYPRTQKLKIYWEKLKSSSNTPEAIVLINGGPGMSHESFHQATANGFKHDWFEPLRTHYDIYYFDQRGTGNSSALEYINMIGRNYRTYGSADICRDIDELRKNVIKKKKIAVLGESYGGMVALRYAVMFPDSVSKLIIHDSSPSNAYFTQMHINFSNGLANLDKIFPGVRQNMITSVSMFDNGQVTNAYGYSLTGNDFLTLCLPYTYSFEGQYIMALMAAQIVAEGRSDILDAILRPASSLKRNAKASYSSLPAILALVQTIEMLDSAAANSAADSAPWTRAWAMERIIQPRLDFRNDFSLDFFSGYNVINQLGKITAPALIIVGETDFICPPAYAATMKNGISNSRLLTVKNAAHGGFIEQHEYVLGKIRSFLLDLLPMKEPDVSTLQPGVSPERAVRVWVDGAARSGITVEFIKDKAE
ncbi:MAG: alpha/beta fold hydrolase [Candidatus Rifleibacteriota bacterium]